MHLHTDARHAAETAYSKEESPATGRILEG
jgi:hypothetical protein